jgi:hypothetical protein
MKETKQNKEQQPPTTPSLPKKKETKTPFHPQQGNFASCP